MYHLSDSDSHDSDDGIRFKTDSIRYKTKNDVTQSDLYSTYKTADRRRGRSRRSRSRSRSPRRRYEKGKYHKRSYDTQKSSNTCLSSRKSSGHSTKETSTINSSRSIKKSSSDVTKREQYSSALPSDCANKSELLSENPKNYAGNDYKNSHSSGSQLYKHSDIVSTASEQYGPTLPPLELQTLQDTNNIKDQPVVIGPTLPPHLFKDELISMKPRQHDTKKTYGPTLPPSNNIQNLFNQSEGTSTEILTNNESFDTPCYDDKILNLETTNENDTNLSETIKETIDDECYGPLPPSMISNSKAHIALEERALQMKIDKLGQSATDHVTREEWMIELPAVHSKAFGLGPRQFRPNPAPDFSDRSSWTDTPQDKAQKKGHSSKKVDVRKEAEITEQQKYDQEQEKIIKKHKKEKSLVEIHQINLSKMKKDEGTSTRRPFSRDIDLKVNHFDEAQKKAILKKAQLLDNRFSAGQSKFL